MMDLRFCFMILLPLLLSCYGQEELPCNRNGECDLPNAHCFFQYRGCEEGYCACNEGYFFDEDALQCKQVRHRGDNCEEHVQCDASVGYMQCINGVCECPSGEREVSRGSEKPFCSRQEHGDACTKDLDCLSYRLNPATGYCDRSVVPPVCECIPQYDEIVNHECVLSRNEDLCGPEECDISLECVHDEDVGGEYVCRCPTNTTWNEEFNLCLYYTARLNLDVGDECHEDYTQVDARFCHHDLKCDKCKGAIGSLRCMDPRLDMCSDDEDCIPNDSHCVRPYDSCTYGTCSCDDTFYKFSSTSCRKSSLLGGACNFDTDCQSNVIHSFCNEDNICVCGGAEKVYDYNGRSYCYLKAAGEQCKLDRDCLAYRITPDLGQCYSSTLGQVCMCVDDHVFHGQVCQNAEIEEDCGDDEKDCKNNSYCEDEMCQCTRYQHWNYFSEQCVSDLEGQILEPGNACDSYHLCYPWLDCTRCPWEPESPQLCQVISAGLSDVCWRDADCKVEQSRCVFPYEGCNRGRCECTKGFYPSSKGICKPERALGEVCDTTEDCQSLAPFSTCTYSQICECGSLEEEYEYDGKTYCYTYAYGEVNGNHSYYSECLAYRLSPLGGTVKLNSDVNYECTCRDYFVLDEQRCVPVPFGGRCDIEDDRDRLCAESTVCLRDGIIKVCACPTNSTWVAEYNICVHDQASTNLPVGDVCDLDYATVDGLLCHPSLICASCPGDPGETFCQTRTGGIGGGCRLDEDCIATNSVCMLPFDDCNFGICECVDGYYPPARTTMTCNPARDLGEECEIREDCWAGVAHSLCINNVCTCAENEYVYTHDGQDYCYRSKANEFCYYYDDCLTFRLDEDKGDCVDDTTCGCKREFVLVGELCTTVPFGEQCVIDGVAKECDLSLICDFENNQCTCAQEFTWDDQYELCIHDEAVTNLGEDEVCNEDFYGPQGLLCEPFYKCSICSERNANPTCQVPVGFNITIATTGAPTYTTGITDYTTIPQDEDDDPTTSDYPNTTW